jgi:hypothetical protein
MKVESINYPLDTLLLNQLLWGNIPLNELLTQLKAYGFNPSFPDMLYPYEYSNLSIQGNRDTVLFFDENRKLLCEKGILSLSMIGSGAIGEADYYPFGCRVEYNERV